MLRRLSALASRISCPAAEAAAAAAELARQAEADRRRIDELKDLEEQQRQQAKRSQEMIKYFNPREAVGKISRPLTDAAANFLGLPSGAYFPATTMNKGLGAYYRDHPEVKRPATGGGTLVDLSFSSTQLGRDLSAVLQPNGADPELHMNSPGKKCLFTTWQTVFFKRPRESEGGGSSGTRHVAQRTSQEDSPGRAARGGRGRSRGGGRAAAPAARGRGRGHGAAAAAAADHPRRPRAANNDDDDDDEMEDGDDDMVDDDDESYVFEEDEDED